MGIEDTLPQIIYGECKICRRPSEFVYFARQDGYGEKDVELYNCRTCGGTVAEESVERIRR